MSLSDVTSTPLLPPVQIRNEYDASEDKHAEWISFLQLVQKSPRVYRFMVLMGMVIADDKFEYSGISKWIVVFWNYLMVFTLWIYFLPQLALAILDLFSGSKYGPVNHTETFTFGVQVFVIWFGVFYLRRAIREPQWLNRDWYLHYFEYSLRICKYVLLVVFLVTILSLAFYINFSPTLCSKDYMGYCPTSILGEIQFVALLGGSCYLVGCLFVLIVEQRISLMSMKSLVDQARDKTVTHSIYFKTRNSIKSREERLPVNIVVFAALLNAILGITLLILYITLLDFDSTGFWIYTVGYELSAFGREVIILLVLLYEIVQVNDQAQVMIKALAESEWGDRDSELVRQSVFMACIGKPIGATIFYKKPTRNQILLQLASSIVVTIVAILKAYFVSKV